MPRAETPLYRWDRDVPVSWVGRGAQLTAILRDLRRGGGVYLLGGRGMGKSAFLRRLEDDLSHNDGIKVLRLRSLPLHGPPHEAVLHKIALDLDAVGAGLDLAAILSHWQRWHPECPHLVLLFDEFDHYVSADRAESTRLLFGHLEGVRRDGGSVGILVAGGIGTLHLRDTIGSDFLSRARKELLTPFTPTDVETLMEPMIAMRGPVPPEVTDALLAASGGNPALVTYGLQELSELTLLSPDEVRAIFLTFAHQRREFVSSASRAAFGEGETSTLQLWRHLLNTDGPFRRTELEHICSTGTGTRLKLLDAIDLLRCAGLVTVDGSDLADPIGVRPVIGLLNLPEPQAPDPNLQQALNANLLKLLGRLHRMSADFFRSGTGKGDKRLVPESTFSAILALGLDAMGWHVEREAQSGGGRTDLLAWRNSNARRAIVEVKIWARNDYAEVQSQIRAYATVDTVAFAVVMLRDGDAAGWPEDYARQVLTGLGAERIPADFPIAAHFSTPAGTDGVAVAHFLLPLARRAV